MGVPEPVRGGTLLFTFPAGPIKCAGAPQKIMYLAAHLMRRKKIHARIIYASAAPTIFGIKAFQEPLMKVVKRYGIETLFNLTSFPSMPTVGLQSSRRTTIRLGRASRFPMRSCT